MSIVQTVIGAIVSSGGGAPPTPTYELTAAADNIDEGASLTFTANTTLVPNGTTLYWACTNTWGGGSLRFVPGLQGEFIINSNTGSFSITISADNTTAEGEQRYSVFLYSTGYPDGQGSGGLTPAKVENILVNDTSLTPVAPFSLQFRGGGDLDDYLRILDTQTDWNLGTTYTIEYWSKHDVGTDTVNATMNTVMSQANEPLAIDVGYIDGHLMFNAEPVNTPEPTPAVWTHVAFVREAGYGTITLYYNGVNVTTFDAGAALTFGPDDLYIGRRAWNDFQYFVGKLAMIRVSSTAKYLANFNPIATYGVEADTKLMLGSDNPLTDLALYELNGITTVTSNGGTLYFSKATYPNLNNQVRAGDTVVNVNGTGATTSTTTGAVFTADPDNWGVPISPGQGGGTKNFSGPGRHPISVQGAVTASMDFPTTYTITPEANSVNEGASLEFTVGGTKIANGNYYWTVTNSGDFGTASGSFSITSNTGSFSVTPTEDVTTEGAETFTVSVRSVSITGTVLATSESITITDTSLAPVAPFSLEFNQPQGDFLSTPASNDWNLGNNWTIEFWIRSNNNSASNINIPGGQWGLINQGGWYGGMPNDNCILVGMAGGNLTINQSANDDIQFTEPTTQVWTHVAIVNNGGGSAQKVYYNGVEQVKVSGNYTSNGKTNTTADLYIGRLSNQYAGYASHFDGKMAMVRISGSAMYAAAFTPTITYGVEESGTKLFLSSDTPTVDSMSHTVTNNGVTQSTDFPVVPASITITNVSIDFNTRVATVDFTSTVSQSDFASVVFEWFGGGQFAGPFNLTVNPGSNIYTSPALSLSGAGNDLTTEISIGSGSQACNSNTYIGSWSVICLVEGTMITMADGSHKAVEDVGYNDLIRVWNFDLGEFSEALPVFVKREETHNKHNRFTFSDGTVLRTVGHHVFNKQAGAFTMLVRDTTPVGTITVNEQGEEVTLISKETIEESVRFYNVWTQYHLNLFADGILTSNRFNNIYPIRDMKFVKDARALRPLEEFANIDPKYIAGLRLQEQPAHYSAEYIRDYVENKLERLDIDLVSTQ